MSDEENQDAEDETPNAENEDGEGGEGEDGEESFDEDGESDDGGKKKLIIIIAAVLLLLVGGGGGAYFMGLLDPLLGKTTEECTPKLDDHGEPVLDDHDEPVMDCPEEHAEKGDDHAKGKGDDHGKGDGDGHGDGEGGGGIAFLEIPPMIVNLNTEGGQTRYLRLSVQLEFASHGDKAAVEGVLPRVVDQFQTYLRELRVRDLRGSAGIYRLQTELLWRVNQAAAPVKVKDVLFQEILIQ